MKSMQVHLSLNSESRVILEELGVSLQKIFDPEKMGFTEDSTFDSLLEKLKDIPGNRELDLEVSNSIICGMLQKRPA